eukprot:CAMPEP_0206146732 /NCGR_PEP_ID=MMETSP1473-20131121/31250_1 /ASSEMBLY_ACC=CAM_ASM_001109 /TAXON_ID=1461547 /ORGANISM="Stichococcus sp, Strain RCC1054" /LENGTH=174 /DNA_ID=CAMNT_0053543399 /DNA_START=193 /DNA_END=718 /DNA_ORIENTATION=+
MSGGPAGAVECRRGGRVRKVSERIGKVGDADLRKAAAARLDALENDGAAPDPVSAVGVGNSDDEYQAPGISGSEDDDEEPQGGAASAKRRSRANNGGVKKRTAAEKDRGDGPQSFAQLLTEAGLHGWPSGRPSYVTVSAQPPVTSAARKFAQYVATYPGTAALDAEPGFAAGSA